MDEGRTRCSRCGGTTNQANPGSITQWVATCNCDLPESPKDVEAPQVTICAVCMKRINSGREGSFTQWIFRADLCKCSIPQPRLAQLPQVAPSVPQVVPDTILSDTPIEVDEDKFPTERYKPLVLLGSGSGGSVYLCHDPILDKKVALKTLNSHLDKERLIAFQREAKSTSKLNHPNIIKVLDFGVTRSENPFMVMEYFQGTDLKRIVEEDGPLDSAVAVSIFLQVCDALAEAHELGIFHRDVKSSNILVRDLRAKKPEVRIIDFGVAVFRQDVDEMPDSESWSVTGTLPYMSPDQANGYQFSERSEIYSFGCTFFEALTGSTPFSGSTPLEILNQQQNEMPPTLSEVRPDGRFTPELESLVARCLARDPHDRYDSMLELSQALRDLPQSVPSAEIVSATVEVATKKRIGFAAKLTITVMVIALAGAIPIITRKHSEKKHPSLSRRSNASTTSPDTDSLKPVQRDGKTLFVWQQEGRLATLRSTLAVTDDDLYMLAKIKDLHSLNLDRSNVTGVGLSQLRDLPIEDLDLSRSKITDEGLLEVAQLQSLRNLYLEGNTISNLGLSTVARLQHLAHLRLDNVNLSGNRLRFLKGLNELSNLDIPGCALSDRDVESVLQFPRLRSLGISYNPLLTGRSIETISHIKELNDVNLAGLSIRGNDLKVFSKQNFPNLRTMCMNECSNLTKESIQELRKRLPDCRIDSVLDEDTEPLLDLYQN